MKHRNCLQRWEEKDKDVREFWARMNDWAFKGFAETYQNLGVSFDQTQHESETYLSGKVMVQEGLKSGNLIQEG